MDTPEELRNLLERVLEGGAEGKKASKELNGFLRKERDTFLMLARALECSDCQDLLLEYLQSEKESQQKLGIELVRNMRRPTLPLLEPVADLSRHSGAKEALLRFPHEALKKELHSLIKSRNEEERICGLELARHLGSSAEEFAPLIAEVFSQDLKPHSSRAAVHTLAALLPEDDLAKNLKPALDHWDEEVQRDARVYLQKADAPIRDSVWEGHPFSQNLRIQLQRLGFSPKGGFEIPEERPLPDRQFEWGERTKEDEEVTLSPAVWAFLHALERPPYHLYTLWGSGDDAQTFYFSAEPPIYVVDMHKTRCLMHVIGDGSIGYYATINLKDTSDDPGVYYIERWGASWSDGGWRVGRSMSAYLRRLGSRHG